MNNKQIALNEAYDHYGNTLIRYATSITLNKQDAEDVVQEVFITAYEKLNTFDGENLRAWLYKITYNKCINLVKRRKFKFVVNSQEALEKLVQPYVNETSEELLQCLAKLKPEDRALLYSRVFDNSSYEIISKQTGKTEAALRKKYERIKNKLKNMLDETTIAKQEVETCKI